MGQPSAQPLLTPDDILVIADGDDLAGIQVHGSGGLGNGARLWTRTGGVGAGELEHCSVVGGHYLWFADPERGRGQLIDDRTGAVLASLPSEGETPPLLDGYDAFARQGDNTLCCFDLGAGRMRWRSTEHITSVVAARGDAIYAILESDDLAILDRASGALRRRISEWSSVFREGISGDALYLSVRLHDADALAVLSLSTGSTLWTQVLPSRTEVQTVWTGPSGIIIQLREPEASWMLGISQDGRITGVVGVPVDGDHEFKPLAHGILDIGSDSERVLPMTLPASPAPLQVIAVDPGLGLPEAGLAALPKLHWSACGGGGAYAVATSGAGLLVFAKGDQDLIVHLADAGSLIDSSNTLLSFSPSDGTARFERGDSHWRLTGQIRVGGDQGPVVARIDPPLGRPATAPLLMFALSVDQAAAMPVWLTTTWQTLNHAAAAPGK